MDLAQTNSWRCLAFLQLPANPYLWANKSAPATHIEAAQQWLDNLRFRYDI
jgi:hypothetical protein